MLYSPLLQAVAQRLSLAQGLSEVANRSYSVGDDLAVQRQTAIFSPDVLRKVSGFAPFRNMALEQGRLGDGEFIANACQAHVLKNLLLIDGNFYRQRAKHMVAGSTKTLLANLSAREPAGGVVVASRQSHAYFGHWMTDELPLASEACKMGRLVTTRFGRKLFSHELGYINLHGVAPAQELPARCILDQVTVLTMDGVCSIQLNRMRDFRQQLRRKGMPAGKRAVFLRRGDSGSTRSLVNETEVMEFLEKKGFSIVSPEKLTAQQLVELLLDTDIVMGVEGSHLAHGLLHMSETGTMLVIQPPNRFNNPFKDLCDATGRRYGFCVASPQGGGFYQDTTELGQLLALAS